MNLGRFNNNNIGSAPVRRFFPSLNWGLVISTVCLLAYGVLFVRSACDIRVGPVHDIWKRMLWQWIPLGMVAHIVLASVDYRRWVEWAWLLYAVALLLLILVLVPGLGTMNNMHARRWLFGVFQPSEAGKVAIVPMLALLLTGDFTFTERRRFTLALATTLLPAGLVLIQPDLGSSIPYFFAVGAMLFVAGTARRLFLVLFLAGALAVSVFLGAILLPERISDPERKARVEQVTDKFLFGHWKDRILVFVYPERDPLGAGWNRRQSEIAIGSGGVNGKGWKKGTQNQLGYLPASVSSSDFIFSVIGEETGWRGSSTLIAPFALMVGSIVYAGLRAKDEQGRLICTGVATIIFVHAFINLGMTIGVMPITGIPLPLVSYGGTFTICTLALLGLAHSVTIHRKLQ